MTMPVSGMGYSTKNEPAESRIPAKVLGQNDFLKLVVAQLANQDPLKPQGDTEFIAQMAQFTTLEQTKTMQTDIAQMRAQQQVLQGMSLLNRPVAIRTGDAAPVMGIVDKLDMEGDTLKVWVAGKKYDLKDVIEVRLDTPELTQN
jgi:flagellar basal-body rod modification protein FlgD